MGIIDIDLGETLTREDLSRTRWEGSRLGQFPSRMCSASLR